MVVPIKYRKGSPVQATYSFSELLSGIGFINLFLAVEEDSAGLGYVLTEIADYSANVEQNQKKDVTIDYDSSTLNTQRTASGTALISLDQREDAGNVGNVNLKFHLFKVKGAVETAISSLIECPNTASYGTTKMTFIEMPLTDTVINRGEFIRLRVAVRNGNAGDGLTYGIDPKDRDGVRIVPSGAQVTSISKISIPFKIVL